MSDLEAITRLADIIRLQRGLIDDLYSALTRYMGLDDLEKAGILDRIKQISSMTVEQPDRYEGKWIT